MFKKRTISLLGCQPHQKCNFVLGIDKKNNDQIILCGKPAAVCVDLKNLPGNWGQLWQPLKTNCCVLCAWHATLVFGYSASTAALNFVLPEEIKIAMKTEKL